MEEKIEEKFFLKFGGSKNYLKQIGLHTRRVHLIGTTNFGSLDFMILKTTHVLFLLLKKLEKDQRGSCVDLLKYIGENLEGTIKRFGEPLEKLGVLEDIQKRFMQRKKN